MAIWIDRKYVQLIGNRLRNFKEKSPNIWNASCPFCGDSNKNKFRARLYIYEKDGYLAVKCHNCGHVTNIGGLIKHLDDALYQEYKLENYLEKNNRPKITEVKVVPESVSKLETKNITLDKLPITHPAVRYIHDRMVPKERWSELFYVDDFKAFLKEAYPELDQARVDTIESDARVVMFLTDLSGNITHVNARAIDPNASIRYVKKKVTKSFEKKVFGIQRIDWTKTIYVVEGEFDSMFLDNCVASGDSALSNLGSKLKLCKMEPPKVVLVYDCEPRNLEITKQMKEAIENGHNIAIWPDNTSEKDINAMIQAGRSRESIQKTIEDNTFQGLEALLMFNDWRKRNG